jgi:RNA polymerase sigma-70 factor (ECF subfamily)
MNVGANDLDDLEQEILVRLWKVLGKYDEERAAFRTWLSRIIQHKAGDHFRKAGRLSKREAEASKDKPDTTTLPELEAIVEAEWKHHLIKLALQRVSEHFTERAMTAFQLSMKGRSTTEIAEQLDIKPNSVNKLKNRVKLRLVQEIEQLRRELEP